MTIYRDVRDIEEFPTPWGRVVRLQEVDIEGGLTILRVRIREGRRMTDLELTADSAQRLGRALVAWAASAEAREGEPG